MQHQNQDESGEKNTAVRLNKEIVLPTTVINMNEDRRSHQLLRSSHKRQTVMNIGVSIGPYFDRIETVPDAFEYVEVGLGEGERPIGEVDVNSIIKRLDQQNLDITVHLPYYQPLATAVETIDSATLSYLDSVLETASALGATTAVAHPTRRGIAPDSDQFHDQLHDLVEIGRVHDITVCFETTGYAGDLALERVGATIDDVGGAICLDIGYAYLEAGVSGIRTLLTQHSDIVEHLHVHDGRHRGDTHIPVGSGDVAMADIGSLLQEFIPEATATIEVFTDDTRHLTDSRQRFVELTTDIDSQYQ